MRIVRFWKFLPPIFSLFILFTSLNSFAVINHSTLSASPTTLSFGNVNTGSTQSLSLKLTNSGRRGLTVSSIAMSGSGFSDSGLTLPLSLSPGQSATLKVSWKPAGAGAASGSIKISSNASDPTVTVALSGTGVSPAGSLTITPSAMNLGSAVVGSSASASGTLSASGGSVTVTSAATNDSAVFSIGGLTLPVTIPAGSSSAFKVTFSPTTSGTVNATLTVSSNASNSTATAALTGSGTAAPTHKVNLSWNASTSSGIAGYNVYRAVYTSSCGSFGKINSALVTSTVYSDASVTDGTAYCYAATAVDSSNTESGYSNIVSDLAIPTT